MVRLLSVNVGLPQDIPWNGVTVRTGAWKRPVAASVTARRLGLEGDGQADTAGHGGQYRAVLVYQRDSYRFWEQHLNRPEMEFGTFAENLTVDGLADHEVFIGDRYRIGDAEFEVTQPRVTCYRAGLRLGEPNLAAQLVAEHRPGFYMRVIHEGRVRAGDTVARTSHGPGQVSVAAIDALLYLPDPDPETLRRAVEIPALSPGWQVALRRLLEKTENPATTTSTTGPPQGQSGWSGFRDLEVLDVVRETSQITSLTLAATDGPPLPRPEPGQYLTLRLLTPQQVVRTYSLSGSAADGHYRISVKREVHGLASAHLSDTVEPGSIIAAAAPRGQFTLHASTKPVILVSAGVGITPVLAMLHHLADTRSSREIWWLHTARTPADAAFLSEVRSLAEELRSVRLLFCFSQVEPSSTLRPDELAGRLTPARIRALALPRSALAYVCGPTRFMSNATEALIDAGLSPENVYTEVFGSRPAITPGVASSPSRRPHKPEAPTADGPMVTFVRSGISAPFDTRCSNLLEFAESCDIPTRWQCRTGVCHTCETPLVAGTVDYQPTPLLAPDPDAALICCARPHTDTVLDI
jgi:ferredoxin-NADP reductase/MOSC domain-containing protein YiiM/ferredoxin